MIPYVFAMLGDGGWGGAEWEGDRVGEGDGVGQNARVLLFTELWGLGACKLMKHLCEWVGTSTRPKCQNAIIYNTLWLGCLHKHPTITHHKCRSAIIYSTLGPGCLQARIFY